MEVTMSGNSSDQTSLFADVELGLGTWSWGDKFFWGYGNGYNDADIEEAFKASVAAGIKFFDTAEIYGSGRSERMLGKFLKDYGKPLKVASKFMPYPWRVSRNALPKALHASLSRLGLESIDLYQIHWPYPPITLETWMEMMVDVYQKGLIKAVGISNCDRSQMQRCHDALVREGVRLASNQVEYNLLNRKVEKNGLLDHCKEMGVTLIAYSPMAMGVLTGKYDASNPPSGIRGRRYSAHYLERVQPLLDALKRIGASEGGKTSSQVALNWPICKGAVPIPGAKNVRQAEQNAVAMGWRLKEEEVALLDDLSDKINE
jgi:aryl-alcohol dehydrogenase-like predicted oxidoreductase